MVPVAPDEADHRVVPAVMMAARPAIVMAAVRLDVVLAVLHDVALRLRGVMRRMGLVRGHTRPALALTLSLRTGGERCANKYNAAMP